MVATIRDLRAYTECVQAEDELNKISKQLEQFSEWYCQFFFEEKDYENYIDEARDKLDKFAEAFHELAKQQLQKEESERGHVEQNEDI